MAVNNAQPASAVVVTAPLDISKVATGVTTKVTTATTAAAATSQKKDAQIASEFLSAAKEYKPGSAVAEAKKNQAANGSGLDRSALAVAEANGEISSVGANSMRAVDTVGSGIGSVFNGIETGSAKLEDMVLGNSYVKTAGDLWGKGQALAADPLQGGLALASPYLGKLPGGATLQCMASYAGDPKKNAGELTMVGLTGLGIPANTAVGIGNTVTKGVILTDTFQKAGGVGGIKKSFNDAMAKAKIAGGVGSDAEEADAAAAAARRAIADDLANWAYLKMSVRTSDQTRLQTLLAKATVKNKLTVARLEELFTIACTVGNPLSANKILAVRTAFRPSNVIRQVTTLALMMDETEEKVTAFGVMCTTLTLSMDDLLKVQGVTIPTARILFDNAPTLKMTIKSTRLLASAYGRDKAAMLKMAAARYCRP